MPELPLTREFSICLLPTDDVSRDVQKIRQRLSDSPYRDDIPHITLLRGITSSSNLTDEELTQSIEEVLSVSGHLPMTGTVNSVTNKNSQFYSASGLLILDASPELINFKKEAAKQLTKHDYIVEAQELSTFIPHITVRLGVSLKGSILNDTEELFQNRAIVFSRWVLFRLIEHKGKRVMHEAWPVQT